MVAKVRSVLKTARTETHKVIMALTCPSTAALYPPCRHHYHHLSAIIIIGGSLLLSFPVWLKQHWDESSKRNTPQRSLFLPFFHSRIYLHPFPDCVLIPLEGSMQYGWWQWCYLSHHGDHIKREICCIEELDLVWFSKLSLPPAVVEMILDSTGFTWWCTTRTV